MGQGCMVRTQVPGEPQMSFWDAWQVTQGVV